MDIGRTDHQRECCCIPERRTADVERGLHANWINSYVVQSPATRGRIASGLPAISPVTIVHGNPAQLSRNGLQRTDAPWVGKPIVQTCGEFYGAWRAASWASSSNRETCKQRSARGCYRLSSAIHAHSVRRCIPSLCVFQLPQKPPYNLFSFHRAWVNSNSKSIKS